MLEHAFEKLLPGETGELLTYRRTTVGWAIAIRLPARWRFLFDYVSTTQRRNS